MAVKEKRPMIKLSVGALYYAINIPTEPGVFDPTKFEDIVKSEIIKNVNRSEESETTPVYASGKRVHNMSQTSGVDIQVEVIAFDPEDMYALRGEVIEEDGLVFGGGSEIKPFVAIGYPVIKTGGKLKLVWYPKCMLSENSDDIATGEESFSEQNDTLMFTAMAFNESGQTSVEIDTETALGKDAKEDVFFAKVITKSEDYTPGA